MNKELKRATELAMHRFLGNARWWTVSDFLFRLFDDGIHGDGTIDIIVAILDKWLEDKRIERRTTTNLNTGMEYNEYKLVSNLDT